MVLAGHVMVKARLALLGHNSWSSPGLVLTTWAQKRLLQQQDWMGWACWQCSEKQIHRRMTHSLCVEINTMTGRQVWGTSAPWERLAVAVLILHGSKCTVQSSGEKCDLTSSASSTQHFFSSTIQTLFSISTSPFMTPEETDFGCYTAVFTQSSPELCRTRDVGLNTQLNCDSQIPCVAIPLGFLEYI